MELCSLSGLLDNVTEAKWNLQCSEAMKHHVPAWRPELLNGIFWPTYIQELLQKKYELPFPRSIVKMHVCDNQQ